MYRVVLPSAAFLPEAAAGGAQTGSRWPKGQPCLSLMMRAVTSLVPLLLLLAAHPTATTAEPSTATVDVNWALGPAASTTAIPTYLDQVNPSMDRASPMHDVAFSRMDKLGAKLVRYLHWSSSQAPFAELQEGVFNFTKMCL